MDPLTALGLASAIAQLLDFGAKVLQEAKKLNADSESERSNYQIRNLALDLSHICQNLTTKGSSRIQSKQSKEEQDLHDLAVRCNSATQELGDILTRIYGVEGDAAHGNAWTSIRAAFEAVKSVGAIERLSRILDQYRSQLTLRLLLVLNAHHSIHGEKLDQLQEASKEIVEVISLNYRDLTSSIQRNQEAIVAAIFTARDGSIRSLTAKHGSRYIADPRFSASSTTYGESQYSITGDEFDFTTRFGNDIKRILDALHFRSISERRGAIPKAHRNTFEWIWRDANLTDETPWDNLAEWLKNGQGCYWLSGKAGCGKSSLMKYLHEDPRTMAALKTWAGNAQLVTGSFYFWYAGNILQKSQMGLLRSLLHDVLSSRPDMCLVVFPDVCRSLLSGKISGRDLTFTDAEINAGFSSLAKRTPRDMRILFFVDGLDEYIGNHNDICNLFSLTTASSSIKILFSSRPIPVCVDQFSGSPKLALQDLTRGDIQRYTTDNLGTNPILQGMEMAEAGISTELVESVTSKACGVFLWVVLVVKRLITCLQNYDSMADLTNEIEKLPSDLEKLYEHMLGSQSVEHRVLGSRYLQLVLCSMDLGIDLHLLQLSFAERDSYKMALKTPIGNLTPEAEQWQCRSTEGRLRSRCCGLIEATAVERVQSDGALSKFDKKVQFFHRTVAEFLQLAYIWHNVRSLTADSEFDTLEALISSTLAEFKAIPFKDLPMHTYRDNPLVWRLFRMLAYERKLEKSFQHQVFYKLYLPEFKRVIQYYWHDSALFTSSDEEFKAVQSSVRRSASQLKLSDAQTFVLSCLIRTPIDELGERLGLSITITPAHMVAHFVDETDERIRLSMAKSLLLGEKSSYCPLVMDNNGAQILFENAWTSRWHHIGVTQNSLDSLNVWTYLLHYVFAVVRLPASGEARTAMSSAGMMVSLLEAILTIWREDGHFAQAAYPNIFITTKKSDKNHLELEQVSDIGLIAELLWQFWSKTVSPSPICTSSRFSQICELSCDLEDLISRQDGHYNVFWSTLKGLVLDNMDPSFADLTRRKEKGNFSKKLLRFGRKDSTGSAKPMKASLPFRDSSVLTRSETPWRAQKTQVPTTNQDTAHVISGGMGQFQRQ